jgi:hypothetical protein
MRAAFFKFGAAGKGLGAIGLLRGELIALQAAHDGDDALIDVDQLAVRQRACPSSDLTRSHRLHTAQKQL